MNSNATRMTVLLVLLAVAWTASAQRRGIRTCSCQVSGFSQQGKLVGSVCYVVGVGSCRSFAYEQPKHQQQQQYATGQRRFGAGRFPYPPRYQSRFDTARPSRFNTNQQTQYSNNQPTQQAQYSNNQPTQQTRYNNNQPTQYNTNQQTQSTQYNTDQQTQQNQYNTYLQNQYNNNQPTRLNSNQPTRYNSNQAGRFDVAASAATASPEQHRSAAEETRRQLESRRTYERELVAAGVTVRPGSAEAAQANERKPDDKSAALGNKALEQILYLQSLLGRSSSSGRR